LLALLPQRQQRCPAALLLLIVAKATMHKRRAVKRFLRQHAWVPRAHLAPSSPEYKPIARFWRWLQAKGYGATAFATIDDVMSKGRQLMEHSQEGGRRSPIHFDFKDYQRIV